MSDGLFGRTGGDGRLPRRSLASIATLLDLFRVGGLANPRDLRTLAEALDDPAITAALTIPEAEREEIRRRADAAANAAYRPD